MPVSFPIRLLLGTVLGFLSGIGIGGGSLLVLYLTVVRNASAETVRTVNLLFFLPAALISLSFRVRHGTLKPKPLIPAIVAGCVLSALCSLISLNLNTNLLKKGFGILLVFTGIRELLYQKKKAS